MRAAIVALSLSGCSFVFVSTLPSDEHGKTQPRCSTSAFWPIVDAAEALGDGVSLALVASGRAQFGSSTAPFEATALVADALLEIGAAAYGSRETARCERAIDAWDRRRRDPDPGEPPPPDEPRFCFESFNEDGAVTERTCRTGHRVCAAARDHERAWHPERSVGECIERE